MQDATAVNRYLDDQLTEPEREAFEARLLEEPEVLAELEATARMKVGLQRLRSSGELRELLKPAPLFRQPWMLSLAAGLALVIVGVGLVRWNAPSMPSVLSASGQGFAIAGTYTLLQTRNENYDAVITLPRSQGGIELRLFPDKPSETASYSVALARVNDDGSVTDTDSLSALQASPGGFITVFANSSRLSPGKYRVTLNTGETFLIKAVPE
jgi:hypothetical protein